MVCCEELKIKIIYFPITLAKPLDVHKLNFSVKEHVRHGMSFRLLRGKSDVTIRYFTYGWPSSIPRMSALYRESLKYSRYSALVGKNFGFWDISTPNYNLVDLRPPKRQFTWPRMCNRV